MNILVTRHDKIGDFCTALPVMKVLKEQTVHEVVVLCSKITEDLAKNLDFIDEVIVYEDDILKLSKKIKEKKIDVSISCYIEPKLGLALLLAGVKTRIAPATKIAQIFFNKRVKQRRSQVKMSEFEYNLELLKSFDNSLKLEFKRPLVEFDIQRQNRVLFHCGFGGSSDGNLSLQDYIKLAKSIKDKTEVIFTFGPADEDAKNYIKENSNFTIKDDFDGLWEFTKFISTSKLFVSTSTGPMHLAGLSNTPTLSFFGDTKFASYKRWKPVSDESLQNNFLIPKNFDRKLFNKIKQRLQELV